MNFSRISSFFGKRHRFRTTNGRLTSSFHPGVDFPAKKGTAVPALDEGVVEKIFYHPQDDYGNYVMIRHPNGTRTLYAHLDSFDPNIKEGMKIKKGTRLGGVGTTGDSTGYHLHLTYYDQLGNERDPLKRFSLEELNHLSMQAERTDQTQFNEVKPCHKVSWWKLHMPPLLGGYTEKERQEYLRQQDLSREIFKGVTKQDLLTAKFSEAEIQRMENLNRKLGQSGLLAELDAKSRARVTGREYIKENFTKGQINRIAALSKSKRCS